MYSFGEINLKLFDGFFVTLELFVLTLIFGLILGLVLSFGSMSRFKPLSFITKTFIWIIRGTPLMLQILVVFYAPGLLFHMPTLFSKAPIVIRDDRFMAALVTFIINYSCYFSEIFRGGIQSIPIGQYEAGQVLGMSKRQTFFRVVLLQVIKRIVPPMSNEVITLIKDTSLVRVISVVEIIRVAEKFTAKGLIWPLFYTGVFYLVACGLLTIMFGKIEKKLSYFKV